MSKARLGLLALLAGTLLTCDQVPLTAPSGSTLTVFANPTFIVANGGVSVISALLTEEAGTTVPDGTVVQFFTDLGRIPPQGETKDGVARVNLVADSRSGVATIQAFSGGVAWDGTLQVTIGSALPENVIVTANPAAIRSNQWSSITANVFDGDGNPVANVPVIFSVASDGAAGNGETLDSGGAQQFTDTNGQAFDTLRSRRPLSELATATVSATTANDVRGDVDVTIN
jgi:hypothetical protein